MPEIGYEDGYFGVKVAYPELKNLALELQQFGPQITRKYLKAALNKAAPPALAALRQTTPKGPTGNLRRAITKKAIVYDETGNGVLLVGYTLAGQGGTIPTGGKVQKGKDRAFHAGLIEFGTAKRSTNNRGTLPYQRKAYSRRTKSGGYAAVAAHVVSGSKSGVASSFGTLGAYKMKGKGNRVQTNPKYPKAFFKRAPKGQAVNLGSGPAIAPIARAFRQSAGSMKSGLSNYLSKAVENAGKEVAYRMQKGI
jgi:hypothetical protein